MDKRTDRQGDCNIAPSLRVGEYWDIYKFDTNERVGVFLARRSVQHLVFIGLSFECLMLFQQDFNYIMKVSFIGGENKIIQGKSPTVLTRCFC
jgi:hypothetical protein